MQLKAHNVANLGGSCRAARSLVPCAAAAALGVPPPLTPQYPPNIPPTPQFYENLQILPLGNVRLFRRIRKNDTLFLKMCVFREHLVNLCVFRGNLVNSLENLQILPLGSVCLFRRIHKNVVPFLKTCVFFHKKLYFSPDCQGTMAIFGFHTLQWGNVGKPRLAILWG